jgi:hypothetical protein
MTTQIRKLRFIKVAHTIIWALFAGSIVAIPVLAWFNEWTLTGIIILFVLLECLVLVFNHMRCPLTDIAARYTDDRADNFDIYLPLWLARNNKIIFGTLFVAGLIFTLLRWTLSEFLIFNF